MKYIRTADGRIMKHPHPNEEVFTSRYKIIKCADSIEELCDAYVLKGIDIIYLNKEHTKFRFEGSDEWFDITDTELRTGIYGAIWTDKFLLYAAKMNEKGELKLIC